MEIKSLFDLSGKVAVVTGGADGIGKGCCEILASAGASVVVSDLNADKAKVVTDGIVAAGGKAIPVTCNVLQDADLVNLIDTTVKTFGTVNILVNNAGLGGRRSRKSLQDRCRLCRTHLSHQCVRSLASVPARTTRNEQIGLR